MWTIIRRSLLTRTDQKFLSLALSSLWKLHSRIGRVQLQVKGRGLDGLLLFAGQSGEAVGKCVGDAEIASDLVFPIKNSRIECTHTTYKEDVRCRKLLSVFVQHPQVVFSTGPPVEQRLAKHPKASHFVHQLARKAHLSPLVSARVAYS